MSKRNREKRGGPSADKPAEKKPVESAAEVASARKSRPPAPKPAATKSTPPVASKPAATKSAPPPSASSPAATPAPAAKKPAVAKPARTSAVVASVSKASEAANAVTVAPPSLARSPEGVLRPKRARGSQPPEPAAAVLGSAPVDSSVPAHEPHVSYVEPATRAEPTLEEAASIAVQSDRAESEAAARLARGSSGDRLREAAAFGSSQSLLSTDYYFRQYGAHGMRSLVAEVDDFGFDPHVDNKVKPLLEAVCKRYFRVELVGADSIPAAGRALLVANRAGALPWDGLVLRTALRAQRPELSPLRWLAEDSVIHYPFMGVFMNRLGAVRACPENAERLLAQNRLVAVFPEGAQGSRKLFRDRYRLQRFGRGGYVKLALKLRVPIFPTAIIGAEDINPVLGRSRLLGRIVGSDSVPLTPTFPWLGLAGLLPAPVRWRIAVGAPIDLSGYGPEAADDALVVHRLNEQIRSALQALVDQGKSARGNALFG